MKAMASDRAAATSSTMMIADDRLYFHPVGIGADRRNDLRRVEHVHIEMNHHLRRPARFQPGPERIAVRSHLFGGETLRVVGDHIRLFSDLQK